MSESAERKPVHPTTDRTWRNTEYDLTKVPLEAARIFYRTRLEVSPSDSVTEPWQAMLEVFLSWIVTKELRRLQRGSESLMAQIPRPEGLMTSKFVLGSFTTPAPSPICGRKLPSLRRTKRCLSIGPWNTLSATEPLAIVSG